MAGVKKGQGEGLGRCRDGRATPRFRHTGDDSLRDIAGLLPWNAAVRGLLQALTLIPSCLFIKIRTRPEGTEGEITESERHQWGEHPEGEPHRAVSPAQHQGSAVTH